MSARVITVEQAALSVAADMNEIIRDLLFSEWEFPLQHLRCAYEEESPESGDVNRIEVVDEDGEVWLIDLTVAATRVGHISEETGEDDE